jgi:hypothetical protein
MFKRKNAEIDMLLTGLLALSALIGGLHHLPLGAEQKTVAGKTAAPVSELKKDAPAKEVEENVLADAPVDEIFTDLQPLIISNSVEKMIKLLIGIPFKTVLMVLRKILDEKEENLDRDDRIEIIVGVADQYKKQEEQYGILDLIIDPHYLYLRQGTPILVRAAHGDYPQIIPVIKAWYADRVAKQENHAQLCEELESRALAYAVENSQLDELKAMVSHGVTMDINRISELLVDAVKRRTGCKIIEFLLEHGADINHVVNGHTALIWAIKNNDLKAVQFLVQRGADVNKIGDNKIGNPRQVAGEAVEKAWGPSEKGKKKTGKKRFKKNQIEAENNAVAIEAYLIENKADN